MWSTISKRHKFWPYTITLNGIGLKDKSTPTRTDDSIALLFIVLKS